VGRTVEAEDISDDRNMKIEDCREFSDLPIVMESKSLAKMRGENGGSCVNGGEMHSKL